MRRIRLKLDKKLCKKCNTTDSLTAQTPETWRANATKFEVGSFDDATEVDLTGYTSLQLVIRPDRLTANNLAFKEVSTPDSNTITLAGWTDGTEQHVTFSFSDAEMNFDLNGKERGTYWLAVTARDASNNETTLGASWFIIEEDNNATADPPPENEGSAITEETADARYIPKSQIDAKGDIITGTADNAPTTLTSGANGQVLVADSTANEGLRWATISGTGDMQAADYDSTLKGANVYDMANMDESANAKVMTSLERTAISDNTDSRHNPLTVSDTSEIDLTVTGQQELSASIVSGSIDSTKLNTSVNSSLGLADSSIQAGDDASTLGSGSSSDNYVLTSDGSGGSAWEAPTGGNGGGGDVTGPASSTDNALARYDGTSGDFIQDSSVTINDSGDIVTSGTVDGRDLSVDGAKLDLIEDSADVTDTDNVTSAGALMDSEVTNLSDVKSFDPSDYAPALGADDNYVTDAEKVVIGNISGSNTGDEPDASTTIKGIIEIATQIDIDDGSGSTAALAVTPFYLKNSGYYSDRTANNAKLTADEANVVAALDGATLTDAGTPASDDKVLIQDTSDSNNLKYVDVSDIGGGGNNDYVPRVLSTTAKTTGFTAVIGETHYIDTSGGGFTATLPAIASGQGRIAFYFTGTGSSLTLDPNASETIEGKNTIKLDQGHNTIENDGSEWKLVQRSGISPNRLDPPQITANQDGYNPSDWSHGVTHLYVDSDASREIQGFEEDGFHDMEQIVVTNDGSNDIVIKHDTATTASNRVIVDGEADFTLGANQTGILMRDGTLNKWRFYGISSGSVVTSSPDTAETAIWIDAGALLPDANAEASSKTGTNGNVDVMLMANTEKVYAKWTPPPQWDGGDISVDLYWTATGATAGHKVKWNVAAQAGGNDDAWDVAFPTPTATADDEVIASGDIHIIPASAITVGGTPADGDCVFLEIERTASGATQMSQEAELLGVRVNYENSLIQNWYISKMGSEADDASGTGEKTAWVAPAAGKIHAVHSGCSTATAGGALTVDVQKGGTTILSTMGIIDSTETSTSTGTAHVLTTTPTTFAAGDRISFLINTFGGTGAKGLHTDLLISWD